MRLNHTVIFPSSFFDLGSVCSSCHDHEVLDMVIAPRGIALVVLELLNWNLKKCTPPRTGWMYHGLDYQFG